MNFDNWKWLNESKATVNGNGITIYAPGHKDWFRNPIPNAYGGFDKIKLENKTVGNLRMGK